MSVRNHNLICLAVAAAGFGLALYIALAGTSS